LRKCGAVEKGLVGIFAPHRTQSHRRKRRSFVGYQGPSAGSAAKLCQNRVFQQPQCPPFSKTEARRKLIEGAFHLGNERITDAALLVKVDAPAVLKVGKRRFLRLVPTTS
jgi:hypothetical protein